MDTIRLYDHFRHPVRTFPDDIAEALINTGEIIDNTKTLQLLRDSSRGRIEFYENGRFVRSWHTIELADAVSVYFKRVTNDEDELKRRYG